MTPTDKGVTMNATRLFAIFLAVLVPSFMLLGEPPAKPAAPPKLVCGNLTFTEDATARPQLHLTNPVSKETKKYDLLELAALADSAGYAKAGCGCSPCKCDPCGCGDRQLVSATGSVAVQAPQFVEVAVKDKAKKILVNTSYIVAMTSDAGVWTMTVNKGASELKLTLKDAAEGERLWTLLAGGN